jgi:putative hemolysin
MVAIVAKGTMDVLLIVFLTLLNGAFAMSEMALAASRKVRLLADAQAGDKGSAAALELMDQPTRFLSSVQVGITSIGMLNGIVGEAAFAAGLGIWLQSWGLPPGAAGITATALVVTAITFVTIVFGELVPKRIGQLYPEPVARLTSRPMVAVAALAGPFVRLLSFSTQVVLKLLRVDVDAKRSVTEEEIEASLEEGVTAGVIEQQEHQMVRNVFHLDERLLTSIMRPRAEIEWLDAADSVAQAVAKAAASGHSWYPVCRGGLDDVVGVVKVAALLAPGATAQDRVDRMDAHTQPAVFVPETLTGMELLERFRTEPSRLVMVVDEYGVVQGMLTPLDLLEAITGELKPQTQIDAWAVQRADGSWLLDGVMPVSELKARLDIRYLPAEEKGRYNTLAGLLLAVSGKLLHTGESLHCAGWRFEVVDLDGRRIDKVLATALPPPPPSEDEAG